MRIMNDDEIPVLPGQMTINDEFIMMGITGEGVIVQYSEPDVTLLIEWEDIVNLGKSQMVFIEKPKRKEIPPRNLRTSQEVVRIKSG